MTNLKRQTVLTVDNPIPSPSGIHDISFERNRTLTPPKPFRLLINDQVLKFEDVGQITVPFLRPELIFKSYKFDCDENICIFQTTSNEFLLLKNEGVHGQFKLFSINKTFLFDNVYYLPMGNSSLFYQQLAITYVTDSLGRGRQRKTKLFYCANGFIQENIPSTDVEIVEIFGPFPILKTLTHPANRHTPWWVALCEDSYYRVFYNGFKEKLHWVINKKDKKVMTFKRFLPTFVPNSYYFLTKNNRELLVHGSNGKNQESFDNALDGPFCKGILPPKTEPLAGTSFFLGIHQNFYGAKEEFPFSFKDFDGKEELIS